MEKSGSRNRASARPRKRFKHAAKPARPNPDRPGKIQRPLGPRPRTVNQIPSRARTANERRPGRVPPVRLRGGGAALGSLPRAAPPLMPAVCLALAPSPAAASSSWSRPLRRSIFPARDRALGPLRPRRHTAGERISVRSFSGRRCTAGSHHISSGEHSEYRRKTTTGDLQVQGSACLRRGVASPPATRSSFSIAPAVTAPLAVPRLSLAYPTS